MDQQILDRRTAAREGRRHHERNWQLNLSFINDEQWVAWDKSNHSLRAIVNENNKPRLVSNLIKPRLKQEYGELTAIPPSFRVDASSRMKAKPTYYFLKSVYDKYGYEKEFRDALLWACSIGTGAIKRYWDGYDGPSYNGIRDGDPKIVSRPAHAILLDPLAKDIDEALYIFDETVRTREYVKKKWGVDVSGDGIELLSASVWKNRVRFNQNIPTVTVTEYWERPNKDYPEGRLVIFSGTTELYSGPNPYGTLPYELVRHTIIPGEAYGDTWVTSARQINVLYNRLRSDMLDNALKLSSPPLISPLGAIIGDVTLSAAEIIKFNPMLLHGGKIDQVKIEPYPPQTVNTLLRLEQEMDELSGTSTKGGMPRGVRSAQQFSALRDKEELRRQTVMDEYREAIERTLNGILELTRRFSTLPRYVQAGNEELLFKASDIPPDALVKVKAELKPSTPPEEEQKMLFSLLDRKLLQDPRPIMRLTRYGNSEEVFTDIDMASSQAQREHKRLLKGEPVEAQPWHNHPIHKVEHNRFRMSPEYEKLPDNIREFFDAHVTMHDQMEAAQAPPQMTPERMVPNAL